MDAPKPPNPDDLSKVSQLWQWAIAGIGLLGGWTWNHTMGRIKAVETGKLDKSAFEEYAARAETTRQEMRTAQIALFQGQERVLTTLARIEGKLERGAP